MKKRVFIVHAWGFSPKDNWYPWLKKQLEKKGFSVFAPVMPDTKNPKIEIWVPQLAKNVGKVDENTYFIGHSIGCQTILRYLEALEGRKIGGVVFIAGWMRLKNLDKEERKIAKPWLESKINFKKIKRRINKAVCIFSDNDPYVPIDNQRIFKKKLGSKIITKRQMFHFDEDHGVTQLPIALSSLLEIAS